MSPSSPQIIDDIALAARTLEAGGLVAFPTETVYGLGADAMNPDAIRRLYQAKGRPEDHPVIVHIGYVEQLGEWAREIPDMAWKLAEAFWPGPLTMILPKAPHVPDQVTGGQDSVGLRMPSHPVGLELLRTIKRGIAAPSANRFGRLSPTRAEHVIEELGDRVDYVLAGDHCTIGIESTIISLLDTQPRLLRPGHILPKQIEAVLGIPIARKAAKATERAPGMLPSHYAPQTPVRLIAGSDLATAISQSSQTGDRIAVLAYSIPPGEAHSILWKTLPSEPQAYAHELYAALRELDRLKTDLILIESVPNMPEWEAVRDRLSRAAALDPLNG